MKTSAQVFCYTFPRGEYEIKTVDPRSRKSKGTIVEGDNSSIEIEAPEGLTSENVKIALTFYRPKYYAATSITCKYLRVFENLYYKSYYFYRLSKLFSYLYYYKMSCRKQNNRKLRSISLPLIF